DDDEVVSMGILEKDMQVLHVTNRGVGKRTNEDEYRVTKSGRKGVYTCKLKEDTGQVVKVLPVTGTEDLRLMTVAGVLIRISIESIAQTRRNTQGVRLISIQADEEVATVAKIEEEEVIEENEEIEEIEELPEETKEIDSGSEVETSEQAEEQNEDDERTEE